MNEPMNLITKYKQLNPESKDKVIMIIAWCILGIVFVMPFQELVYYKSETLKVCYYRYGYDHSLPRINLLVMIFISAFGLTGKSTFNKIMIVLIPALYVLFLNFYPILIQLIEWGRDYNDPLAGSFLLMLVADGAIISRSWMALFRVRKP